MDSIRANFSAFIERKLTSQDDADAAIARISTTTEYEAAGETDLVIDAVPAVRETQIEVFGRLDRLCAPDVVLAST